jgi:hypothetical protein
MLEHFATLCLVLEYYDGVANISWPRHSKDDRIVMVL